jgi:hypothetical protein
MTVSSSTLEPWVVRHESALRPAVSAANGACSIDSGLPERRRQALVGSASDAAFEVASRVEVFIRPFGDVEAFIRVSKADTQKRAEFESQLRSVPGLFEFELVTQQFDPSSGARLSAAPGLSRFEGCKSEGESAR